MKTTTPQPAEAKQPAETTPTQPTETETEPTETTAASCCPLPPAFVLRSTDFGEVVSHGLGMTNEGIKAFKALASGKSPGDGSLLRAIENSHVKNLSFDWTQRHDINSFMATVAGLHRDEKSTREALSKLDANYQLPTCSVVPASQSVISDCHLAMRQGGIEEVALWQVEDVCRPWISKGLRRACVFIGDTDDYEIVMNLDAGSWTIAGVDGKPLTVPGASYTILRQSKVIGVGPDSSTIGFSNIAFPFMSPACADPWFDVYYALEIISLSTHRPKLNYRRGSDFSGPLGRVDLVSEWQLEVNSALVGRGGFMFVEESLPQCSLKKLIDDAEAGYLFILADGNYLSMRDANWCEGILSKEDVGSAVLDLGDSLYNVQSMREAIATQRRFIQMACEVNWECRANPTPERIDAILKTWREFNGFLESKVKQLQS